MGKKLFSAQSFFKKDCAEDKNNANNKGWGNMKEMKNHFNIKCNIIINAYC